MRRHRAGARRRTRARNREQPRNQPRGGARGFSGWRAAGSRAVDGLRSTSTTSSGNVATTTAEISAIGGGETVPRHITQCADVALDWGTPGTAGSIAPVSTRQIVANAVGSTACRTTASAGKAIANRNASKAVPAMDRRWANSRMGPDVTRSRRTASNPRSAPAATARTAPGLRFAPNPSTAHQHRHCRSPRSPCGVRHQMKFLRAGAPSPYAIAAHRYFRCAH